MDRYPVRILVVILGVMAMVPAAFAQQAEDAPRAFGGPDSVDAQLKEHDDTEGTRYWVTGTDKFWQPWYDWKKKRQDENGFNIGLGIWLLYQDASESASEEDDAFGAIYRLQGTWTVAGRDTPDHGGFEFRVEKRETLGSGLSPSQLGAEVSSAATNSGFLYTPEFRTDLSVFNYTQRFNGGTAGIAIGRLAFDAYLDPYPFQSINKGFNNRAFIVNPALGTTGIGALGVVMKGFVSDQIVLGGSVYDGNAASGDFDLDTIQEGEFLKAAEIAWSPSPARYKTDRIQFTYWHRDALTESGVKSGQGWVLSASYKLDKWLPFLRMGDSDGGAGTPAEKAISTGFEFTPRENEALSVGIGWARPVATEAVPNPRGEYVFEASYRFPVTRNFTLIPDVQLLVNPIANPDQDRIWVLGLRGIFSI